MQKIKKCTRCDKEKELDQFFKDKSKSDGHRPDCKKCSNYQIKNYQKINKNKISKNKAIYYIKNKKKISLNHKKYYIKNRKSILKQVAKYAKNKRNIDIRFKIKSNLRTRISKILTRGSKSLSTMFLIGCEIDYLMFHIQEQFTNGMSWDNYGDWHIDHKLSCASFDLSDPKQQKICFNYKNLQPLWALDNLRKLKYVKKE